MELMKCRLIRGLLACLLAVCLLASLLSGCEQPERPAESTKPSSSAANTKSTEQEEITLRVLIEGDMSGRRNYLQNYLKKWVREYSDEHENVQVVIEEIPKEEGREEALKRLRTELMIGEGPDILLLPTSPTLNGDLTQYVEPLIPDVQQAIQNGLFLDISAFYEDDAELNTGALHQVIMDAGLYNGSRFVLPLSFDMPVAFVDKVGFAESGIPQDIFDYNAIEMLNYVAQMEDPEAVGSFWQMYYHGAPLIFNFFPQLMDYENIKVEITAEDLTAYLRAWLAFQQRVGTASQNGYALSGTYPLNFYGTDTAGAMEITFWAEDGLFAACESMLDASCNLILARTHGVELDIYPMRAVDGSVVADVTLYTAVSSGSKHPELAYGLMREFLSERFQWQTEMNSDLAFYGWPVRTEGSTAHVCKNTLQFKGSEAFNGENISDAELPVLNAQIDHVRFSIALEPEFADTVLKLYDVRNNAPADTDLDQLAQEWINKLQHHADEG